MNDNTLDSFTSDAGYLSNPIPLGPAASPTTYLHQHPLAEAYIPEDGAMHTLKDNGQDLAATIGRRTVRLHAFAGALPDIEDQHNLARHVTAGRTFAPTANYTRCLGLDDVTAPFGGRAECGPARCEWGTLVDPRVLLTVTLPGAVSAILTVDGVRRDVQLILRDADDSSCRGRVFVVVRNTSTGAALLIRGTALDVAYRHVAGSMRLAKKYLDRLAAELPVRIAAHADLLRRLAGQLIDEEEMHRLALVIAAYGDDNLDAKATEAAWRRAVLVSEVVKSGDVGASPIDGFYTALQLFEAACVVGAGKRHGRDAVRDTHRVLDGEPMSECAMETLDGWDGSIDAPMPGDWAARFTSAENLPELSPLPDDLELPEFANVEKLRHLWCTTLAPSAADADDRIARMARYSDPLEVLAIVAPYVPVRRVGVAADAAA